jgi:hypothetical protein
MISFIPSHYIHHTPESMVSERKRIEERLRKKQAEVAGLEDKLRTAKVYVAALQDVLKMFGQEDAPDSEAVSKLRAGSAVARAREIILERGEPTHLDELIVAMGKPLTQSVKSSLVGSLAAYVRQNEIFARTAPNTFGLLELGHDLSHGTGTEEEDDEPPAGFGRQPVTPAFADDLDDMPF